jgi:hypothetical protein
MKESLKTILGLSVLAATTVATFAIVTFDAGTGAGFVGKGDVQLIYGWNNKALQDNAASVRFRASSSTITETTWTCDRDGGPQTQERANTTTTTTEGLVSSIARERNQITGFILSGYNGTPVITTEHDGPAVSSCPTGWSPIDLVVGEPVPVEGGGLQVSGDLGVTWVPLPITPVL